jgi:F-type H+-transporting ATPase subunit a
VGKLLKSKTFWISVISLLVMIGSAIYLKPALPNIQLPPEPIPGLNIFGFPITNTFLAVIVADITLLLIAFFATKSMSLVPGGLQNMVEWVIESLYGLVEDIAGPEYAPKFFTIVMTIFLLVLVVNWWELIPGVDSIGIIETGHHVEAVRTYAVKDLGPIAILTNHALAKDQGGGTMVSFLRVGSSDLNFTLALALFVVFWTQVVGVKAQGLKYFGKFVANPLKPMDFFIGILEMISELVKIISFSFRLFGNLFAGQVLLFVMPFLIPLIFPVIFFGLETFVGVIQAFIFAILSLVFFTIATLSVHGEEAH